MDTEVAVIGSGPGGYTAAFRAADLGKKVTLIEYYSTLGGVCLNVGCIPSKALLHAAKIITDLANANNMGINLSNPKINLKQLRSWILKNTVNKLTSGLKGLAKKRKIQILQGYAEFISNNELKVTTPDNLDISLKFKNAIIATGSKPIKLPCLPYDPRIINSTEALEIADIPKEMLVIGGGIIGMEMSTVYDALGTKITVVEILNNILGNNIDTDLVNPLFQRMQKRFKKFILGTKVTKVDSKKDGLYVTFEGKNSPKDPIKFDKILSCIGRIPNSKKVKAKKAGVYVDEQGFIPVNTQQCTNIPNIYAIGDVVGQPMLAHKAILEGKIAAEVISGKQHFFNPMCIPSVAYTDPEIAWIGVTETSAQKKGIAYDKGLFPWIANGRSLCLGENEGLTKIITDLKTNRIIGAGIVGNGAGDLISELGLAIEMGCDIEDIALTIHPHPTLSETIGQAAELIKKTITDLYIP